MVLDELLYYRLICIYTCYRKTSSPQCDQRHAFPCQNGAHLCNVAIVAEHDYMISAAEQWKQDALGAPTAERYPAAGIHVDMVYL